MVLLQVPLKLPVQSGGDWGINIGVKRIERLTYKFGKIGINLRLSKILNYQLGNLPTGNILKNQRVVIAIVEMNQLIFNATPEKAKIMIALIDYLERADVENRLIYAYISEQKLPIGSGAIESLIRQVVNLRMKGNSKFWLKSNAEIILHLRCQWIAGSWDNFCNSIFTSFLNPQTSG